MNENSSGILKPTPFIYIAFFYLTGILLSPIVRLDALVLFLGIVLSVVGFLLSRRFKKIKILVYFVFVLIGVAQPQLLTHARDKTAAGLEEVVRFSGVVVSEPDFTSTKRSRSFILTTDRIDGSAKRLNFFTFLDSEFDVKPGYRVEGIGRIERNDSRYFMGKWLFGSLSIEVLEKAVQEKNYNYYLAKVRSLILRAVTYGIKGDEESLITGLMLGVRTDMPPRVQRIFSDTGTVHILAVSGLHLGIIAFVVFFLIRLVLTDMKVSMILLGVAVILYTMLIGDVASLLRATVMTELVVFAALMDKDKDFYNITALSACLLLAVNPYYVYNVGFQLSYAAVLGMIAFNGYFMERFKKLPGLLRENVAVSFSAQMLIIPFILVYFHRLVLISYVVNIFAVPISSVNIIIGFISFFLASLGLWPLVKIINLVNSFLMTVLLKMSEFCSRFYYVRAEEMHLFLLLAIILLIAALYIHANYRHLKKWKFGLAIAGLLLFVPGMVLSQEKLAKVIFLNAGRYQDIVFIISDRGEKILFLNAYAGKVEKTVPKTLMAHNTETIDLLILSGENPTARKNIEALESDFKIGSVLLASTNLGKRRDFGSTSVAVGEDQCEVRFVKESLLIVPGRRTDFRNVESADVVYADRVPVKAASETKYIVKDGKDDNNVSSLDGCREIVLRMYDDRVKISVTKW